MDDLSAYYSHYILPAIVLPPPPGVAPIPITSTDSVYLPTHPSIVARDEVRTLFVAGLPEDVKPREIYNLFCEFPGYATSHLRASDGAKPFAFTVFSDLQSAVAVMHALNFFRKLNKYHANLSETNFVGKNENVQEKMMVGKA